MIRKILLSAIALCASQVSAGPISKFDKKKPDLEMTSSVALFDLERCLTDIALLPMIYRQPDRPGEVKMLWDFGSGIAAARIDLSATPSGVAVKVWDLKSDAVKSCIETGKAR